MVARSHQAKGLAYISPGREPWVWRPEAGFSPRTRAQQAKRVASRSLSLRLGLTRGAVRASLRDAPASAREPAAEARLKLPSPRRPARVLAHGHHGPRINGRDNGRREASRSDGCQVPGQRPGLYQLT